MLEWIINETCTPNFRKVLINGNSGVARIGGPETLHTTILKKYFSSYQIAEFWEIKQDENNFSKLVISRASGTPPWLRQIREIYITIFFTITSIDDFHISQKYTMAEETCSSIYQNFFKPKPWNRQKNMSSIKWLFHLAPPNTTNFH